MNEAIEPAGELLIRYRGINADWKSFRAFLQRLARELAARPFTVGIVSDAAIRRLNWTFRRKDSATDVLSFPSGSARLAKSRTSKQPELASLGDIVISAPTAARAARELGWPLDREMQMLALHGLLHLMGFDHETDRGQMARAERTWGRRLGLPRTILTEKYRKSRQPPGTR